MPEVNARESGRKTGQNCWAGHNPNCAQDSECADCGRSGDYHFHEHYCANSQPQFAAISDRAQDRCLQPATRRSQSIQTLRGSSSRARPRARFFYAVATTGVFCRPWCCEPPAAARQCRASSAPREAGGPPAFAPAKSAVLPLRGADLWTRFARISRRISIAP